MSAHVCIVGAGPGGLVLGLLLARRGVRVTVLEAQADFDRDFRGDTVHPSTLALLEQLGLAQKLLALDHAELRTMTIVAGGVATTVADFGRLDVPFPFVAMIPQSQVLELLADEARRHEHFELRMHCRVTGLLEEPDGRIAGVRFEGPDGPGELRATLTVGADGRGSKVRRLAGFEAVANAASMDVLWLRLPRRPEVDADQVTGLRVGVGHLVVVLSRPDEWQLGYVILKGEAGQVRAEGLPALRAALTALLPELAPDVATLTDWSQTRLLSVESSCVPTWHRQGLLLIGDAAHTMSPIGGVGINYAIQDAVAATNLLAGPLLAGAVTDAQLAAVQRRRMWPTRFIQRFQALVQHRLVDRALDDEPFRLPLLLRLLTRLPGLRHLPARLIGWGLRPERLEE